jgi:hypothetical protein
MKFLVKMDPWLSFFNALVSADKGYTPLNLSDNIISDIVEHKLGTNVNNVLSLI